MSLDIKITTDVETVAKFGADKILKQLDLGKNVLWFIPGGSAIAVAVEMAKIITEHPCQNLTVTLTDERYGPIGHKDSNWQQLLEKGFNLPQAKLIPILTGDNRALTTEKFGTTLAEELKKADYRIGLFGVGKDGHIAGILPLIFPLSEAVKAQNRTFSYKAPRFERITITPPVILQLDEAVIFMQGREKWKVIEDLNKETDMNIQPVQILKRLPILTIFTDYQNK